MKRPADAQAADGDAAPPAPPPQPDPLVSHVVGSYMGLHWGTGWVAFLFPIAVVLIGFVFQVPLQDSLSAYFFAYPTIETCGGTSDSKKFVSELLCYIKAYQKLGREPRDWLLIAPVRMFFVGFLAAIAACLYFYKGFSKREDALLNVAAVGALMIAAFPEQDPAFNNHRLAYLHFGGVAILFLSVAAVSLFCSELTVRRLKDAKRRDHYDGMYGLYALLMVAFLVFAFGAYLMKWHDIPYFVLALEFVGIWIFAFYWWTKSAEMEEQDFIKDVWPPRGA